MKNLLLALCLFMTACASTQTAQITPIRVTGTGSTQEQALKNAFREAVQIKVGSAILGARESVNSKLTKDEVANYSAGYVDDYKVIDTNTTHGITKITVDVWVRNSDLAMHKINNSKDEKFFNGDRLDAQYESIKTQRRDATMVYQSVLNDYPSKAFDFKFGKPTQIIHPNNELVFEIPYQMSWNKAYIKSLNEALSLVGDNKNTSQSKIEVEADEGRWFDVVRSYYFRDYSNQSKLTERIRELYIKLTIHDETNKVIFTQCFRPWYGSKLFSGYGSDNMGYHDYHVYGTRTIYDKHYVNVTNLPIKRITNIRMVPDLVRNCDYNSILG